MCERETVGPGLQNRHHWSQDRTTEIPRHYEYWIRPIARRGHAATSRPRGNQKTNRRNKSHEKWRAWMRQSTTTVWPISRTSRAKNRCELHEVPPRRHQAGARSEMTMVGRRVAAMIVALGASMATGSWSGAQSAPAPRSSFPGQATSTTTRFGPSGRRWIPSPQSRTGSSISKGRTAGRLRTSAVTPSIGWSCRP